MSANSFVPEEQSYLPAVSMANETTMKRHFIRWSLVAISNSCPFCVNCSFWGCGESEEIHGIFYISQRGLCRKMASSWRTVRKLEKLQKPVPSDIEIAQSIEPLSIKEIGDAIGLKDDEIDLYGKWSVRWWNESGLTSYRSFKSKSTSLGIGTIEN